MTAEAAGTYRPFDPRAFAGARATGWDAWAEEYAELPRTNAAYRFGKRLLHEVIDAETGGRSGLEVLDFNCGCGNDFERFLAAGHRVVGCDGSAGMLSVAARLHAEALASGRLALYEGRAETLTPAAFGGRRFDLIFSGTGGTAYLAAPELRRLHEAFAGLLAPGGRMVITHLRPRCLVETLHYLARGRPRAALRRWRGTLEVSIRSETLTMYLRTPRELERILGDVAPADRLVALNVVTPPFHTGARLPAALERPLLAAERALRGLRPSLAVCDQVVRITRSRA